MTAFVLLAVVAAAAAAAAAPAVDPVPVDFAPGRALVADLDRIVTPGGVQETFAATLGGVPQVVNVRGADRANPLLVFIHGGPGAVEMPVAWTFQRPWEDFFTVVQYDQRGAGRSYALGHAVDLAATLTPDRYRDDAIELIDQLRHRYGKTRVVLVGLSWGSVVGLAVAAKRPDLLYAYVGIGQLIDFRENERVGFAWTLDAARRAGDRTAIAELEALAPYPGTGRLDIDKTAVERKWNVRYGGLAAGRSDADFYLHTGRLSPEYSAADRAAWDAGSAFSMAALWPRLADVSFARLDRLDVPVILFLGRHDYTAPSPIAAAWLGRLHAPVKTAVWFDNSAHLPMVEEPGRVLAALLEHVRPLTQPPGPVRDDHPRRARAAAGTEGTR